MGPILTFNPRQLYENIAEVIEGEFNRIMSEVEEEARAKAPRRKVYRTHIKALGGTRISAIQVEKGFVSTESKRRAARALQNIKTPTGQQRFSNSSIKAFVNRNPNVDTGQSRELDAKGQFVNPVYNFFLSGEGKKELVRARKAILGIETPRKTGKPRVDELEETAARRVPASESGARFELGGRLKAGIHYTRAKRSGFRIESSVRSEAPYSVHVEFGTKRHGKAQPFMRPAWKHQELNVIPRLQSALRNVK